MFPFHLDFSITVLVSAEITVKPVVMDSWYRHLKGEDLNSLQPKELIMIEEALDNGIVNVNDKLVNMSFAFAFSILLTFQQLTI